jgi:NitT/TauT family transport system substrate-binding protein
MQQFVMEREGYYEDAPVDVTIERFSSGPSVVKAFASGDLDVELLGITPAMVLVDKDIDASDLAANSRNGFKIMGTTELADLYEKEGAATFEGDSSVVIIRRATRGSTRNYLKYLNGKTSNNCFRQN